MHRCRWTVLITLVATVALTVLAVSEELVEPLAAFEPLVGTSWIGRFTSSPAPPLYHLIEWKAILDGQVVQWSKCVEALDFAMETFFYWDQELDAVAFTQLTSNGIHGKGVVEIEDGVISLVGVAMQTWGIAEFKQTFEIMADGTLEDRYYSRRGTGWSPEHVIVYRMSLDEASAREGVYDCISWVTDPA
ncbi:hypothetical protein KAV67_02580 [Candidatus Bipolaricaulota bacterium]|nr:hypothetical protein [Candidatus Bipolaricaulota bacterium]